MHKKSNLVSVIVPVYNVATHLATTLESIIGQEHAILEIICINDGSTDTSLEILHEFARRDTRIVVIDQKNCGLGTTRNRGVAESRGEYLCFLDSDDLYHPRFISKSIEVLQATQADMVLCAANVLYEDTGIVSDFYDANQFTRMIDTGKEFSVLRKKDSIWYISLEPCMVRRVFRKSFIDRISMTFPEGVLYEDAPAHILCGISTSSIALSNHLSFTYRVGRASALTKDNSVKRYDIVKSFSVALSHLNNYQVDRAIGLPFMILFMRMVSWCYDSIENSKKSGLFDLLNDFIKQIPDEWRDDYLKDASCCPRMRSRMLTFETGIRSSILRALPKSILRKHHRRCRLSLIKFFPFAKYQNRVS